jgi:transposase
MVAADARTAVVFALSPGNAHDAPEGRALLEDLGPMPQGLPMLMDKAYEGNETRQLVLDLGMIPVVPPKSNRLNPGNTTVNSTRNATKWNGFSVD